MMAQGNDQLYLAAAIPSVRQGLMMQSHWCGIRVVAGCKRLVTPTHTRQDFYTHKRGTNPKTKAVHPELDHPQQDIYPQ